MTAQRDSKGRFVPPRSLTAPPVASDRELVALLERLVWLVERLLWQQSGTVHSFAQYRQQLRQEDQHDA